MVLGLNHLLVRFNRSDLNQSKRVIHHNNTALGISRNHWLALIYASWGPLEGSRGQIKQTMGEPKVVFEILEQVRSVQRAQKMKLLWERPEKY